MSFTLEPTATKLKVIVLELAITAAVVKGANVVESGVKVPRLLDPKNTLKGAAWNPGRKAAENVNWYSVPILNPRLCEIESEPAASPRRFCRKAACVPSGGGPLNHGLPVAASPE
jgi:hypothetical protein